MARSLEAALDPVLNDRESGSRTIALGVAQVLRDGPLPALISATEYTLLSRYILVRLPAFALVFDLLHTVGVELYADRKAAPVKADRFRAAVEAWRRCWEEAVRELSRQAARVVPAGARLATHSHSGAVLALLAHLQAGGLRASLACSESLPGGEGAILADRVRQLGFPVKVYPDSELARELPACQMLLLGADAVFADRYWNKVGSRALAQAARNACIPHYVLAERAKWVAPEWRFGASPPAPFEPIPLDLTAALVSEEGCRDVSRSGADGRGKPVFAPLRHLT